MPNASHMCSKDGMEGIIFFRYQEEIVDCVKPERSASWYSDQFLANLKSVILDNIFISIPHTINNSIVLRKIVAKYYV